MPGKWWLKTAFRLRFEMRDGCILRVYDGVEGTLTVTARNEQGQESKLHFDLKKDGSSEVVLEE